MSRSRRRWLVYGLLVALLAWSVGIEPRWVAMREIEHAVPQWQGRPGLKVAVAADWHLSQSAWRGVMTPERARDIVDAINAATPDVILLPGDFIGAGFDRWQVTKGASAADEIAAILGRLRAPLGVYATLGNHEWWNDAPAFAAALERHGIRVLENDAHPVDAGLWVVGIGDHFTGHADPRKALARLPPRAQALVMMHDPAPLTALPPVDGLIVAGHTHGGQVALPFFGALLVPGEAPRSWAHGWVAHGSHRMYVTSGLGVSVLPLRFNMRPEWVLFRIVPALG